MNVFSPPVTRRNLLTEERSYPIDATNPGCTLGLALALAASASQYRNNVQHARPGSSGRLRISTSKWQFSPPTGGSITVVRFDAHTMGRDSEHAGGAGGMYPRSGVRVE